MLPILPAIVLLSLQADDPKLPLHQAKDLPAVSGPTGDYPDPAGGGLGNSRMDMSLRRSARQGPSVPAVAVPKGSLLIQDEMKELSGRKAYRIEAPAGASVHVRLKGTHTAWFVVKAMDKWGKLEKGMLQNVIPTGNPEATYRNPTDSAREVFFVVDSTEVDVRGEAFTLTVTVKQP